MTVDEFFEKLEGLGLEWRLEDGIQLRCANGDCPITAFRPDGPARANGYEKVGSVLGLSERVRENIANAADLALPDCSHTEARYRKRLLKACGLEEAS